MWDLLVARGALCKVLGTAKAPHVQDTVHLSMAVSFSSVTTDALGRASRLGFSTVPKATGDENRCFCGWDPTVCAFMS